MSAIGWPRLGLVIAAFLLQTALLNAALPTKPDEAPARPSLAGEFLIAAPSMGDPRFERAVILIVQDDQNGALGIVLNKPLGEQTLAGLLKFGRRKERRCHGQRAHFLGRSGPAGSRLRRP